MPARLVRPMSMARATRPRTAERGVALAVPGAGVGDGGQFVEQGRGIHAGHQMRCEPSATNRPTRQSE